MDLEILWFWLIALLWGGYLVLEGFDFGVGILARVRGRDEAERGRMLETIGPHWDGNEVWLVCAVGAMFAAARSPLVPRISALSQALASM